MYLFNVHGVWALLFLLLLCSYYCIDKFYDTKGYIIEWNRECFLGGASGTGGFERLCWVGPVNETSSCWVAFQSNESIRLMRIILDFWVMTFRCSVFEVQFNSFVECVLF